MSMVKPIDDILKDIDQLPAMPKAVVEIIRCIEDDNIAIDSLAQLVSSDIGLSSSMLKVANTMRFSVRGGIASVHDAVMLIGFRQIRDMVCMVGVMGSFPKINSKSFDYANFWRHSLAVGVCARVLSRLVKLNPDTAYISGMLHDIGELALVIAAPDEFRATTRYATSHDCHTFEAEQAVLEMDHGAIGAHLIRKWGLPEVICDAIEKHHMPDVAPTSAMADLIHVAEVLCHALDLGVSERIMPPLSDQAMARLNINFFQLKPYFSQIECEYYNVVQMLD